MPINAADSVVLLLIILGSIFLYFGYEQNHNGYIVLAIIEYFLAIIQFYLNRKTIIFK